MGKILAVVGMHRSATSLTANWLKKCGLNIGDRLLPPGIGNRYGHFEDLDFFNHHIDILVDNGLPPGAVIYPFDTVFDEEKFNSIELSRYHVEKLKSIIDFKSRLYDQFCWKDPRTCLFLDAYRKIAPGIKYIILYRDYNLVVDSMIRRDKHYHKNNYGEMRMGSLRYFFRKKSIENRLNGTLDALLAGWIYYNSLIIKHVTNISKEDYLLINFKSLIYENDKVFNKLTDWGFELTNNGIEQLYRKEMLQRKCDDLHLNSDLVAKAQDIYDQLENLKTKL